MKQKEFDFNAENIQLVKNLTNEGLSYKAIARKLNGQGFVTKVKHKKLTDRTIANLLQSPKYKAVYTDDNKVHNKPRAKAWSGDKLKAILECNLDADTKLELIESLTGK